MPCSDCPGEGACIPAETALFAYPANKFSGDDHTFYDDIAKVTCPEGNVVLEKARKATLDHALRSEHKGAASGRVQLPEAVSYAVLARTGDRSETVFHNLREMAMSRMLAMLNFLPDAGTLYDFEVGTPFFAFVYAYLRKDVIRMRGEDAARTAHDRRHREDGGGSEEEFLAKVEISRINSDWENLLRLESKLLRFEAGLARRLRGAVRDHDLKPKRRQTLDRAITIIERGTDGAPGHSVRLFAGPAEASADPLHLATVVSNHASRMLYNHSNGSVLTDGLPLWLDACFDLLIKRLGAAELRPVADLTKAVFGTREGMKASLERIGLRREALDETGFSLERWNGPVRIEVEGRVAEGGVAESGQGISDYGGLFGCVPRSSPAVARLIAAATPVADPGSD